MRASTRGSPEISAAARANSKTAASRSIFRMLAIIVGPDMEKTTQLKKLTANVKAAGCAAKLSPKLLDRVLAKIPRWPDENVLVGFDTSDDAGVYQLTP